MLLPEDDVLLGPLERPPAADAPLQGPADPATDLGMTASDLVEDCHWLQARSALPDAVVPYERSLPPG